MKKGAGKPMKKAQNGTNVPKPKPKKTYPIIPENPDASGMLNSYDKDRKSGKIPLDPNIQKGIKNGTLNPDGTTKKGMKKGGMIKKAKSGGSFPDLNKDGKITKADVLKGRGVIAKKGASVKKCKYGCK